MKLFSSVLKHFLEVFCYSSSIHVFVKKKFMEQVIELLYLVHRIWGKPHLVNFKKFLQVGPYYNNHKEVQIFTTKTSNLTISRHEAI